MDFATACRGLSVLGLCASVIAAWWASSGYDGSLSTGLVWLFSGLFSSCALGCIGEISARAGDAVDSMRNIQALLEGERRAREKAEQRQNQ